jgi:hypothetical protein
LPKLKLKELLRSEIIADLQLEQTL